MVPRIIRDNTTFAAEYENLAPGDLFVGCLRIRPGEEHILLDLSARNITLIPSAVSQLCSRSKVFQTRILGKYMIPGTVPIFDKHDVLSVLNSFGRRDVGKVVCKLDRANAGQGVLLFNSVEEIYNNTVLGVLPYPFVVQPFIDKCRDVRVVVLGDTVEAYTRENPDNFRHNMHFGGTSSPFLLDNDQLQLCHELMNRADFPYACIDLLIDPDGKTWLSEINLRGGLRGAHLSQQDFLDATEKINEQLLAQFLDQKEGKV